jgi:hypothetical protein
MLISAQVWVHRSSVLLWFNISFIAVSKQDAIRMNVCNVSIRKVFRSDPFDVEFGDQTRQVSTLDRH